MTFAELRKTSFAFGRHCEPPADLVGAFVAGSKDARREIVFAERTFRAFHEDEVPDGFTDREVFRTVYQFPHAEYARYFVERGGSLRGYAGPAACSRIPWDIDREDDLTAALDDLRKLVRFLRDRYGELADNGLSVAFSGGKGFHAELLSPAGFDPLPHLPAVVKALALAVAAAAGVRIDRTIYHHQALIRLPNTRHPSGRYKRLLDPGDLDRLTVPAVLDMAKHPAGCNVPKHPAGCEQLAEDFGESERRVLASGSTAGNRTPPPGAPVVPKFVRDFIGFGDIQEPGRETTVFRCAAALTEACRRHGSDAVVWGLLEEVALKSGLDPAEVDKAIRDGIARGRGKGDRA